MATAAPIPAAAPEAALLDRVTELTDAVGALPDAGARELAEALAGAVADLYAEGLDRIMEALSVDQREEIASDGLVGALLLMHGLHPLELEARVRAALDGVRPYLASHDGDVELLGVADGVARLRLTGSCEGCGASRTTLEHAVAGALEEAAPDLVGLDVEGVAPPPPRPGRDDEDVEWVELDGVAGLTRGALRATARGLLVANVAGTLLAYHDACAVCRAPLSGGALAGGKLTCAGCGAVFDLPRAGRRSDGGDGQLRPVPLLRNGGPVRVALPRADADANVDAGRRTGCELCPSGLGEQHRHLLDLDERRIVCVCETCWSLRSGDARYRPPSTRTLWLEDFDLPDEVWAAFQIPIGLAFLMRSSVAGGVVALYPSPAGATESELELAAWDALCERNPVLERLEPDAEALIVDRTGAAPRYALVGVDRAYALVGLVKERWSGISGGADVAIAVAGFFEDLRTRAIA